MPSRGRRAVALLAGMAVDACAGLAAAAGTILWQGGSTAELPALVLACTVAALAVQGVLVPGWVLAPGPPARPALTARLSIAVVSVARACAASGASAILFLLTDSARLVAIVMPLVFAGTAALGVARARTPDPRAAAPAGARAPMVPAPAIAAAGAVAAWLAVGGLWALGWIGPPHRGSDAPIWREALLVGPLVVVLAGLAPGLSTLSEADRLPPSQVLRRAFAAAGVLALLAGLLLLAHGAVRRGPGG